MSTPIPPCFTPRAADPDDKIEARHTAQVLATAYSAAYYAICTLAGVGGRAPLMSLHATLEEALRRLAMDDPAGTA